MLNDNDPQPENVDNHASGRRPPPLPYHRVPPRSRFGCAGWALLIVAVLLFILALAFISTIESAVTAFAWPEPGSRELRELLVDGDPEVTAKIAVIDVKGVILPDPGYGVVSSQQILQQLRRAAADPDVVAVVLDMNTPGGEVTASDEIYRAVHNVRAAGKPVVTVIRSIGASGGYLIAAGTDHIIANRMSLTGSIGVIISTINISGFLAKHDIQVEVYTSGQMKDMLSSTRERRPDEQSYVNELVQSIFDEFAKIVADGRDAYADIDAVKQATFSDGRILSGEDAFQQALIDELGYIDDGFARARALAQMPDAKVVRYQFSVGLSDILFNLEGRFDLAARLLPAHLRQLQAGQMYFLAPNAVAGGR